MLKTNILIPIAHLHSPYLVGGSIGRLIVAENDLCPTRQTRNTANGVFNVSFLVFAWNDDRYGKIFRCNRRWNLSRNDHLRHAELAQERQGAAKTDQETLQ